MTTRTSRRPCARVLALLAAMLAGPTAAAHSGGADPGCWTTLGTLRFEVTAWQPASNDARMYCARLPALGDSVLVFDAIDAELAALPVELAVWPLPDEGYAASLWQDPATLARRLLHLPAERRAGGTLVARVPFASPGRYVAALRARRPDGSELLGEFVFEVGAAPATRLRVAALIGALPTLLGAALLLDGARRASIAGQPA